MYGNEGQASWFLVKELTVTNALVLTLPIKQGLEFNDISLLVLDELISQLNETKKKEKRKKERLRNEFPGTTLLVTAIIILWHDIFSTHKSGGNQL